MAELERKEDVELDSQILDSEGLDNHENDTKVVAQKVELQREQENKELGEFCKNSLEKNQTFFPKGFFKNSPTTLDGKPFSRENELYLSKVMETKGYKDPTFVSFMDTKGTDAKIKEGEHGHRIFYNKKNEQTQEWEQKSMVVFNASQIENLKVPEREKKVLDETDLENHMIKYISSKGYEVEKYDFKKNKDNLPGLVGKGEDGKSFDRKYFIDKKTNKFYIDKHVPVTFSLGGKTLNSFPSDDYLKTLVKAASVLEKNELRPKADEFKFHETAVRDIFVQRKLEKYNVEAEDKKYSEKQVQYFQSMIDRNPNFVTHAFSDVNRIDASIDSSLGFMMSNRKEVRQERGKDQKIDRAIEAAVENKVNEKAAERKIERKKDQIEL